VRDLSRDLIGGELNPGMARMSLLSTALTT
jgi:hypothetical protein